MTDEEYIARNRRRQRKRRRYRGRSRMGRILLGAYLIWAVTMLIFLALLFCPLQQVQQAKAATLDKQPAQVVREDWHEAERIEAALAAQGYLRDDVPLSYELQDVLQTECERCGVDYALALGLIETESGFDPDADNGLCYGLMQLNRDYFPADLSPAENIRAGIEYLADQLGRYETVEAALCGYNAGHDTGARDYANAVLAAAEGWKTALENPPEDADG